MKSLLNSIIKKGLQIGVQGHILICMSSLIIGSFSSFCIANFTRILFYKSDFIIFKLSYITDSFLYCLIPILIFFYIIEDE